MNKYKKKENLGVILAFISAGFWGLFPVFVHQGTQTIPPLTYAAISTLLAAVGAFLYVVITGKLKELKITKSYLALWMITLCIVIIPMTLFFLGAKRTSGTNTSFLLLAEIIFTMIFTPFIGEKNTKLKFLGASGIFLGALFILYNGNFQMNFGDLLIILSTVTYPIGNFYAKKALNLVSPATILFVRFLLGGIFISIFALIFEQTWSQIPELFVANWLLFLFSGLVLYGIGKIIWYEGLKRLDISKAISLTFIFPIFSLATLMIFFDEKVSAYQWLGIVIMMVGVYFSVKRKSVDPKLTKYAAESK